MKLINIKTRETFAGNKNLYAELQPEIYDKNFQKSFYSKCYINGYKTTSNGLDCIELAFTSYEKVMLVARIYKGQKLLDIIPVESWESLTTQKHINAFIEFLYEKNRQPNYKFIGKKEWNCMYEEHCCLHIIADDYLYSNFENFLI